MIQVVILAGGKGTRMGGRAKALLDVEGRPFIHRLLDHYGDAGILARIVLKDDWAFPGYPDDIQTIRDGEPRRGTGGAVLRALPALVDPCMIVNGDSFVPGLDYTDVLRAYKEANQAGLMVVYPAVDGGERANVQVLGREVATYSKEHHHAYMHHVDAGVFITSPHELLVYAEGADSPFDLGLIYRGMILANQLVAYKTHRVPFEVGSPEGLERYRAAVREGRA